MTSSGHVKAKELLQQLNLGNSVAEFDQELENYFVETETFRLLISDKGDVIAGDKGTGKTALYKILIRRYQEIPELEKVEIIPGFNPAGSPVFQRLAESRTYNEGQYSTIWKTYILSLIGNWLLKFYEDNPSRSMTKLDELLKKLNLRTPDFKPSTVFSNLLRAVSRVMKPQSAEAEFTFNEQGMPVVTPKLKFGEAAPEDDEPQIVRHSDALGLLNEILEEVDMNVWVVLDRLDEAFQGWPATELPALRSLFRTYLDVMEFDRIRLKLFVRRDLFRKITQGGFVNLTHINARKLEIVWDEEDLMNLLIRRIRSNIEFSAKLGLEAMSREDVFYAIFPDQVDAGLRRAKTWSWVMSRIKDANGVKPPRNLIDLVKKAQEAQLRQEDRDARTYKPGETIITPEAIRNALSRLSKERVEDTLLAESGEYADHIEKFRDGKAEHSEASLEKTLNVSASEAKQITKVLMDMGFLEQAGSSYKVPALYREGLNITQGKDSDF